MTKLDKIFFSVIALLLVVTVVFWKDVRGFVSGDKIAKTEENEGKEKKKKSAKEDTDDKISNENYAAFSPGISVEQRWDLPSELREISGIAHVDDQRFICVQDEEGIL